MPEQPKYSSTAYAALKKQYGEGFTLTEQEFDSKVSSDSVYASNAYKALKNIYGDGFTVDENSFYDKVGLKKKGQSNGTPVGFPSQSNGKTLPGVPQNIATDPLAGIGSQNVAKAVPQKQAAVNPLLPQEQQVEQARYPSFTKDDTKAIYKPEELTGLDEKGNIKPIPMSETLDEQVKGLGTPSDEDVQKQQSAELAYLRALPPEGRSNPVTWSRSAHKGMYEGIANMAKGAAVAATWFEENTGFQFGHTIKPEDYSIYKFGQYIDDVMVKGYFDQKLTPEDQQMYLNKVFSTGGQMIPMVLGGSYMSIVKVPTLVGTVSMGAMMNGGMGYAQAIGMGASVEDAKAAGYLHTITGSLEGLPISSAMKRLDKFSGGMFSTALFKKLERAIGREGAELALEGTTGAWEETAQEVFQNSLDNVVAANYYDVTRKWYDGLSEAATIAPVIGFTMSGMVSVLRNKQLAAKTAAEKAEIQRSIDFLMGQQEEIDNPNTTVVQSPTYKNEQVAKITKAKAEIESTIATNKNLSEADVTALKEEVGRIDEALEVVKEQVYQEDQNKIIATELQGKIAHDTQLLQDGTLPEVVKNLIAKQIESNQAELETLNPQPIAANEAELEQIKPVETKPQTPVAEKTVETPVFPQPEKPISEMTADEISAHGKVLKEFYKNQEVTAFGEEGAKKYREAQRVANSETASAEKRKEANAIIAELEKGLTKEQSDAFFGENEKDDTYTYDNEELRQIARAVRTIEESEDISELSRALKTPLLDFNRNPKDEGNLAAINAAKRRAIELGIDPKVLIEKAVKNIVNDLPDQSDRELLGSAVIKALVKSPTETAVEKQQLPPTKPAKEVVEAKPVGEVVKGETVETSDEVKVIDSQIKEAEAEVVAMDKKIKDKAAQLSKTYKEDQSNLFGQRKSSEGKLIDTRVDPKSIKRVLDKMKAEKQLAVDRLTKLRANRETAIASGTSQIKITDTPAKVVKPKGANRLQDSLNKKYGNIDDMSPRTMILKFFAMGGRIKHSEAVHRTGYGSKDLFGWTKKNGKSYHELYEEFQDEAGREVDQGDFDAIIDDLMGSPRANIFKELNKFIKAEQGEYTEEDQAYLDSYEEHMRSQMEDLSEDEDQVADIAEYESSLSDQLTEAEQEQLDKVLERYTVDGVVDWKAIEDERLNGFDPELHNLTEKAHEKIRQAANTAKESGKRDSAKDVSQEAKPKTDLAEKPEPKKEASETTNFKEGESVTFEFAGDIRKGVVVKDAGQSVMVKSSDNGREYKIKRSEINPPKPLQSKKSKVTTSLHEFEGRSKKDSEPFKLHEAVMDLIRKHTPKSLLLQGHHSRRSLGTFFPTTKHIALKGINTLGVAFHEIAHALDDQFGTISNLDDAAILKDLRKVYLDWYPNAKTSHRKSLQHIEGYAMLLQKYLESPSLMRAQYPALVDALIDNANTETKAFLKDANAIVEQYFALNPLQQVGTRVVDEEIKERPKSVSEKATQLADRTSEEVADHLSQLEAMARKDGTFYTTKDAVQEMRLANNAARYAASNIQGNNGYWVRDANGEFYKKYDFNWKTLYKSLSEIGKDATREFGHWLVARRAYFDMLDLDKLNAKHEVLSDKYERERAKLESDPENVELKATVATLKNELAKLKEDVDTLANIVKGDAFSRAAVELAYNQNIGTYSKQAGMFDKMTSEQLERWVQSGRISQEQAEIYRSKEGYASFARLIFDEITTTTEPQFVKQKAKMSVAALKQRTGSEGKPIINPLISAISAEAESTRKSMRQIAWNQFAEQAEQHPELMKKEDLKVAYDEKTGMAVYPQDNDPNILMTYKDGKRIPYLVGPEIKRVILDTMTYENVHVIFKVLQSASRLFRTGTTGWWLPFLAANIPMDQLTAAVNTRTNMIPIVTSSKEMFKVAMGKLRGGNIDLKYFNEYIWLAGTSHTMGGWDQQSLRKADIKFLNKTVEAKVLRFTERVSDIVSAPANYSEIMTRATEYIRAREMGIPQKIALEMAGRVSAPFHHRGRAGNATGREIVRTIAYANAAVEVLAQTTRSLRTESGRKRFLFVASSLAVASTASMLYSLGADDEDEKKKMIDFYNSKSPEEMAMFLYFKSPVSDKMKKIRMPQQLMTISALLNMAILNHLTEAKYTPKEFLRASTTMMPDQFKPYEGLRWMLSLTPSLVRTPLEIGFNKKTFPVVRDIENARDLKRLRSERFDEWTSPLAIALARSAVGDVINMSPKQIDHLVGGLAGRTGQLLSGKPNRLEQMNPVHWFDSEVYFSSSRQILKYYEEDKLNAQSLEKVREALRTKGMSNVDYTNLAESYKFHFKDAGEIPLADVRKWVANEKKLRKIDKAIDKYRDINPDTEPKEAAKLQSEIFRSIMVLEE